MEIFAEIMMFVLCGIGVVGLIILFLISLLLLFCVLAYLLIFPYWVAKRFRITKSFLIDCILSYGATWLFNVFGNAAYLCISAMKNENPPTNTITRCVSSDG